jgi:hypothetical protein
VKRIAFLILTAAFLIPTAVFAGGTIDPSPSECLS